MSKKTVTGDEKAAPEESVSETAATPPPSSDTGTVESAEPSAETGRMLRMTFTGTGYCYDVTTGANQIFYHQGPMLSFWGEVEMSVAIDGKVLELGDDVIQSLQDRAEQYDESLVYFDDNPPTDDVSIDFSTLRGEWVYEIEVEDFNADDVIVYYYPVDVNCDGCELNEPVIGGVKIGHVWANLASEDVNVKSNEVHTISGEVVEEVEEAAVDNESTDVEYLKISFGEVNEEVNWNDARECIDPKQTCFVVVDVITPWALIQIGNDVLVLGKDELTDEIDSCFEACAKRLDNSGRSHQGEVMLFSMMKSAYTDEPYELFDNVDWLDPDDPTVNIVTDKHTDLYGEHDDAPFCLIESCSLEAKMSGERVVFDGTSYEIKDLFELMNDYDGTHRPKPSSEVAEFRSEHNYEVMKCILGWKEKEDDSDDD